MNTRIRTLVVVVMVVAVFAALLGACGNETAPSSSSTTNTEAAVPGIAKGAPASGETSPKLGDVASAAGAASPQGSALSTADGGGGELPALPSTLDRKIISNSTLSLGVKDVGEAFNLAGSAARANGGYTQESSFSNVSYEDSKQRSATLTLRVPAEHYDDLLGALRGIAGAKVLSEGSKSTEITEEYTDLQSRQRNLEATEQSYLALLQQAKTIPDILTVNDRLNGIRAQIEQIQGRLKVFDNLSSLATIQVTLSPIVPGGGEPDEGGPKSVQTAFADAWAGSLDVARNVVAGAAVVGVALIWLAIPALVLAFVARALWRRGRDGAGPGTADSLSA
jgi:hypothetical protein